MSFLKGLFGSKDKPIENYADFWDWFTENHIQFHKVVASKDLARIEKEFFGPLSSSLEQLKDGFFFLAGMINDSTAELVLTADGNPKNIVFVEELVDAAPQISGWLFTPLKQPEKGFKVSMNGVEFGEDSMGFFPTDHENLPDLIDITVVHEALGDLSDGSAKSGAYIFLDSFLGELNFATMIDELSFCGPEAAVGELIPIDALPNFLETRQALFVEKYDGVRIFTENDNYSTMQGELASGRPLVALINTDLMAWDKKASHPWMLVVKINYDGDSNNGLPDDRTAIDLNEIEDAISAELEDSEGYLNIGRQAANNERLIFFACVDFRKPSKVAFEVQRRYAGRYAIEYEIFKDKYWQSVSHLSPEENLD